MPHVFKSLLKACLPVLCLMATSSARASCISDSAWGSGPVSIELSLKESAVHRGRPLAGCLLEARSKDLPKLVAYSRWNYFCQKETTRATVRIDSLCCDSGDFPPPCMAKGETLRLPANASLIVPVDFNASIQAQIRKGLQSNDPSEQQRMLQAIKNGGGVVATFQGDLEQLLKPGIQVDVAARAAALLLGEVESKLRRDTLVKAYFRQAIVVPAHAQPMIPRRIKNMKLTPEEESWFTSEDLWILTRERKNIDAAKFLEIFSTKKLEAMFFEPLTSSLGSLRESIVDILHYLPQEKFPVALLQPLKKLAEDPSGSQNLRDLAQRACSRFSPKDAAKP